MNLKRVLYAFSFAMLFTNAVDAQDKKSAREKYNFNYGWKLNVGDVEEAQNANFNDKLWTNVNLPYSWNQAEAFRLDISHLSTGVAWYRKTFQLPKVTANKKVFVEFEGVRQMGEVYVNGKFAGRHENGAMAFGIDISAFVNPFPQENVIAVKTDNDWRYKEKATNSGFQWNDKNFNANYGGIPKNVFLHIKSKVYQTLPLYSFLGTTGTYVYASDFNITEKKSTVNVSSQVKNEEAKTVSAQLKVSVK
ncbi:MAG TPA: beta galactosidase jelly roll domain-containing protein, partial [Flavobacterium sp.]|nr:beta galactosidase jelly roll domain-containing protein [Flavobacterium sp.]